MNGDAVEDLAVANQDFNSVSILLGNGDGTFDTTTNYQVGGEGTGAYCNRQLHLRVQNITQLFSFF